MTRSLMALISLACASCATGLSTGKMKAAPDRDTFVIMPNALLGADQGKVHPVVLERIVATEDGPFARYLEWALEMEKGVPEQYNESGRAWARDALKDMAAIRAMVGPGASKTELLRALGRLLAPGLNAAFNEPGAWTGSADILWGASAKDGDDQRDDSAYLIICKFSRHVEAMVVQAQCFNELDAAYAWDLRLVPEAFEPSASLRYEDIQGRVLDLHPRGGKAL